MYYIVCQGRLDKFKHCLMVKNSCYDNGHESWNLWIATGRLKNMSKRLHFWCRYRKCWDHKKMFLMIAITDSCECMTGRSLLYHSLTRILIRLFPNESNSLRPRTGDERVKVWGVRILVDVDIYLQPCQVLLEATQVRLYTLHLTLSIGRNVHIPKLNLSL